MTGSATLAGSEAELTVVSEAYQKMVGRFLSMLTTHKDLQLKYLATRIDYNEYFRKSCPEYDSSCLSPMVRRKTRAARKTDPLGRTVHNSAVK